MGIFSTLGMKNPGVTVVNKIAQRPTTSAQPKGRTGSAPSKEVKRSASATRAAAAPKTSGGKGWANGGPVKAKGKK